MAEEKIKAIVFDWGGVLTQGQIKNFYSKLSAASGLNADSINEKLKKLIIDCSKDKISKQEFCLISSKKLNISPLKFNQIYLCLLEVRLNKSLINSIKILKKKYKIILLADQFKDKEKIIRKLSKGLFNKYFFSFNIKSTKHTKKPFNHLLKHLNLNPKEVIFIDDSKSHIKIAKKLGINSILFRNNLQLIKDLKKFGVKL
ncbi:HAD-IA family hydrolase [Candidatus Pacearchaeota archaeon]|nr:HAD-IA family hydrolase [Candidatus Pacearchaeota archaeon]